MQGIMQDGDFTGKWDLIGEMLCIGDKVYAKRNEGTYYIRFGEHECDCGEMHLGVYLEHCGDKMAESIVGSENYLKLIK